MGGLIQNDRQGMRREKENRECVGGMRNPRFSAEKVPGLHRAGAFIRSTMEDNISAQPEGFVESLQTGENASEIAKQTEIEVANLLASRLGCSPRRGQRGRFRAEIAAALSEMANDPDKALLRWLDEGASLGVSSPIETQGIFPKVENQKAAAEEIRSSGRNPQRA